MTHRSTVISLDEALDQSDRVRTQVAAILKPGCKNAKTLLLRAYLDLAMEHHGAFTLLVRHKLYGSALSVVRVICEILFYGFWLYGCAGKEEVGGLALSGEFPRIETVITDLDKIYGPEPFFERIMKRSSKALNACTHSSLVQLIKRFKENNLEPNHLEGVIAECLEVATLSIFLLSFLFAKSMGQAAEAIEIQELLETFAKGAT